MTRYVGVTDTQTGENLIVMEDQLTDPKEIVIADLLAALKAMVCAASEARWPLTSAQMTPMVQARAAIARAEGRT